MQGMTKPCMIDIKIQSKPYNPNKIERQKMKVEMSSCGSHGFRMCGYSSFVNGQRVFVDKYVGRQLKADGL